LSLEERWSWRDIIRRREDEGRRKRKETGKVQCSAGLEGIGGRVARERGGGGVAISERTKVVAMMALVMLLCNADRVVMSVAVVPLAAQYGWSSSFVGIVQVCLFEPFLNLNPNPNPLSLQFTILNF
jgi:ACS family sodium-dependent inorganic phosphate cotransporter